MSQPERLRLAFAFRLGGWLGACDDQNIDQLMIDLARTSWICEC
jgi:hypothetical protein